MPDMTSEEFECAWWPAYLKALAGFCASPGIAARRLAQETLFGIGG